MPDEPLRSPTDPSEDPDVASDDVMDRLRARVRDTVGEIEQLRAENERLQQRVDTLEARPAVRPDETFVTLDDDPQAVQRQLQDFIDAIDAYLDANAPSA